jgi:hypothetical protein
MGRTQEPVAQTVVISFPSLCGHFEHRPFNLPMQFPAKTLQSFPAELSDHYDSEFSKAEINFCERIGREKFHPQD